MLPRKTLLAAIALAAATFGTGTTGASAQSFGANTGDAGFVSLAEAQSLSSRSGDVLDMLGHCTFDKTIVPFSSDMVVAVVAKGGVSSPDPVNRRVNAVSVRCTIKGYYTGAVYLDKWDGLPGNAAAWGTTFSGKDERLVVCTQVKAFTNTAEVISQSYPCQDPTLP